VVLIWQLLIRLANMRHIRSFRYSPNTNLLQEGVVQSQEHPIETTIQWKGILKGVAATLVALFLLLAGSILSLRWINPPVTAFVLQESWQELGLERYSLRGKWVGREALPEHLQWAVVASEDQRFWQHQGFDMEAIREALEERREGTRQRGASTISQQVAKNLYLWPAHSFVRKGLEAGITVLIELLWPKERILEVYLNIAEFGPGVFGVGKAAETFFGIEASQLVPEQSARLAAVLPSPKRMRVHPPSPYTQERSRWILRQMTQLSGIRYLPGPVPEEDPEPEMPGPESEISGSETEMPDAESVMPDPETEMPDPEPEMPGLDFASPEPFPEDVEADVSNSLPDDEMEWDWREIREPD